MNCSICGNPLGDEGYNAQPFSELLGHTGRCCHDCFSKVVYPRRIAMRFVDVNDTRLHGDAYQYRKHNIEILRNRRLKAELDGMKDTYEDEEVTG